MSNEVDKRVVQMEFDNKRFEKNVRQTRKSLDELDQSLQFKDAGKGIDEVKVKLSALQVVATTFVANITNKIINLGTILVRSLSVNNIFSGWQKYGDKTISVATLLAQKIKIAGKEITDQAEKLEKVNEQLDLLSWFSDETSYSFTEMTKNLSSFTASGQSLDDSIKAMAGIATWAALAGQNTATASRVMHELGQTTSRYINRQDWSSITTASMDMTEFREAALESAVALGQLTKAGDEFVTKTGKKFNQDQFITYLSEGWFTADVLVKTLGKYSAAVEDVYRISKETGKTASQVLEEYGDQLDAFGVKALLASQQARTLNDAINSLNVALSSKWSTTFDLLLGGNEGSIKFFTDLANSLYDSFAVLADFRNEVLSVWKDLDGYKDLFEKGESNQGAFWNIYDALGAIRSAIRSAWNTIFPISSFEEYSDKVTDVGNKLKSLTERLKVFTKGLILSADNSRRLTELFKGLFTVVNIGLNVLKALRFAIDPIIELGKELIGQVLDRIIYYGSKFVDVTGFIQRAAIKLQQVLLNLIDILDLPARVDQVFDFMEEIFSLVKQYKLFNKVKNVFESFFKTFVENGGTTENIAKILKGLVSIIGVLGKVVVATTGAILSIAGPVLEALGSAFGQIAGYIAGVMVNIVAKAGDMFTALDEKLNSSNFADFGSKLKDFLVSIIGLLGKLAPLLVLIGNLIKKLVDVIIMIPKLLDDISVRLSGKGILDNLSSFFTSVVSAFESFTEKRQEISDKLSNSKPTAKMAAQPGDKENKETNSWLTPFQIFAEGMVSFVKGIGKILVALMALFGKALNILGNVLQSIADFVIQLSSGEKKLTESQKRLLIFSGILAAITVVLAIVTRAFINFSWQLMSLLSPLSVLADSLSGYFDAKRYKYIGQTIESIGSTFLKIAIALLLLVEVGEKMNNSVKMVLLFIVSMAAFIATMYVLIKVINETNETFVEFAKVGNSLKSTINKGVASVFNSISESIRDTSKLMGIAAVVHSFGDMMLEIAFAFLIFEKISPEGLEKSVIAMLMVLGVMITLIMTTSAFSKVVDKEKETLIGFNRRMAPTLMQLVGFSLLINTISRSLIKLSNINTPQLLSAVLSIGFILGALGIVVKVAAESTVEMVENGAKAKQATKATKSATNSLKGMFASVALMIGVLSLSIKLLSTIDTESMWIAFSVIAAFSGLLIVVTGALLFFNSCAYVFQHGLSEGSNALEFVSEYVDTFTSALIKMVSAILVLSIYMSIAGDDGVRNLWIAFGVIISLLVVYTGIVAALTFLSKVNIKESNNAVKGIDKFASSILKIGFGVAVMAGAIGLLILMFKRFESVRIDSILKGVGAIVILIHGLAAIVAASVLLNKFDAESKGFIKALVSMGVVIGSILLFAKVLEQLSSIPVETIRTVLGSVTLLFVALGALLVAANYIKKKDIDLKSILSLSVPLLALAASLLVMSASLMVFSLAMQQLAAVGWETIGMGAAIVAGALAMLIIAAKFAKPVIVTVVALSGAIALLGVGLLMAGLGLQAIVNGLNSLNENAGPAVETLGQLLATFVASVVEGFGNSFGALMQSIIDNMPLVEEAFRTAMVSFLTILNDTGPIIIDTLLNLFDILMATLASHSESIAESVVTIIDNVLNALDKHFDSIANSIFSMLHKLLVVFKSWIKPLVKDLVDIIVELIEVLVEDLGPKVPYILKLIVTFIGQILEGLVRVIIPLAGMLTKVMLILIGTAIQLLITSLGALSSLFIELVTSIILILVHTVVGLTDVVLEALKTIVLNLVYLLNKALAFVGQLIPTLLVSGFSAFIGGILKGFVDILDSFGFGWVADALGLRSSSEAMLSAAESMFDATMLAGDNVKAAAEKATKNIENVVKWSGDSISNTIDKSFTSINDTTDKAMKSLDSTMGDFGEQIGIDFGEGMANGIVNSKETSDKAASELGKEAVETIKKDLDEHSPSRVMMGIGEYVSEGFALGIQNGSSKVEDNMHNMVDKTMEIASSIVDEQNGDDITIKVGLDISSVEDQTQRIQEIMSGIDDPNMSYYGRNAEYASRKLSRSDEGSHVVNEDKSITVNYTNTFNISSTDPQESAEEIDKVLHDQALKAKFAHGS